MESPKASRRVCSLRSETDRSRRQTLRAMASGSQQTTIMRISQRAARSLSASAPTILVT